ncbi:hypothetical protein NQ317_010527 [Molorchus minor]|uniref:Uncharacterized protein n=1 Tax=Molorchus minor TaxID=1323400 RepID=A0ABQ9JZH6_9CUCU|nr:hypothetical protein NQ317_010527 [Molorchus minor]
MFIAVFFAAISLCTGHRIPHENKSMPIHNSHCANNSDKVSQIIFMPEPNAVKSNMAEFYHYLNRKILRIYSVSLDGVP